MSAGAFGGATAALGAVCRGSVDLDQHGVVHVRSERALNGVQIGLMSVGRELGVGRDAVRHVLHEPRGAILITSADEMRDD